MSSVDDRIKDFLDESRENLDLLDRDLVLLEKDPGSRDLISEVFRIVHTMKGTCGFFSFARLEGLTHAAEDVLSRLRDGQIGLDTEILGALLVTVDAVRKILATIEATKADGEDDHGELVLRLLGLGSGAKVRSTSTAVQDSRAAAPEPTQGPQDTSIRVDVLLLDKLMNLVGELVLTRNQMLQLTQAHADRLLHLASQRLSFITTRLQGEVMKTRLQRIVTLWDRLPRTVRDLAVTCGKQVRIEMEGEGTELDKSIIEAIKDPLVHLIRNSIDHGIEAPAARAAVGKPAEGCVRLRAFHDNGQVRIEVRDDGNGVDIERVRRKALATGCIGPERAAHLTDQEVIELIFLPGFSTAETVTSVSGRGVGLDVVKTNIERIGGSVEVESVRGQGTTFSLKIPLTLAIIPALIVTSGGERFAIPQVHLLELVRLMPGSIEDVHGAPVFRLRGSLLPIVDLKRTLKLVHGEAGQPGLASEPLSEYLLVLQAEGRQFGLLVDRIHDTQEIVVKPVGRRLQPLLVFAGATVMGDGKSALILDILNIAQRAGLDPALPGRAPGASEDSQTPAPLDSEKLLLVRSREGGLFAMPLRLVDRLEEASRVDIERVAGRDVLQYRGGILPLVYLEELADIPGDSRSASRSGAEGPIHIVVHRNGPVTAGVAVGGIVDIVDQVLSIQSLGARPGVLGSMVIRGRVTEVLDLDRIGGILDLSGAARAERNAEQEAAHV